MFPPLLAARLKLHGASEWWREAGVSFAWPNLALTLAAAVFFSLALPLTRKRCMLRLIGIMVPAVHIFWMCFCGMFSLCIGCESASGAESPSGLEAWSHHMFREVQKDSDWISCYTEEDKKVLGATARCCTLADKRFWALVRGTNLEVLVLGQDFSWNGAETAVKTRRPRRPRPPSAVGGHHTEGDRARWVWP